MDPRKHPKCSSERKSAQDDPRSAPEATFATHPTRFGLSKWGCRRPTRQQRRETSQRGDFSLHAASNPLGLGRDPRFACRARSDVKNRAGTRTRASKTQFRLRSVRPGRPTGLKTAAGASPDGSKSVPRGLQTAPRALQEAPRELQEASRRHQKHSKRPPDAFKSTSRGSQTLPEVSRPL